ncbi:MAG: hypothetical protein ACX93I_14230 [Winogradskyella sp.]|jgi:hypothetical protein
MDEFLKENYDLITSLVEFIAAITGVLLFNRYKKSNVRYIIYFLIYAFFVDLIGGYPSFLKDNGWFHFIEGTLIERNYWWYTLFWWVGLSTIMFYLNYQIVKTIRLKKILKYGYYIYLLQVILYFVFRFEDIFSPDQFVSIASLWVVVLSIIVYFFEILNSEQIIIFYKSVYFYFNSIFFIWILVIMPLEFFESYFIQDDWNYVLFRWKIHLILNTFLYLSLASVLMFCKPENKL